MASVLLDQDQLSCPVCLDLLKNPVTIPCGHSFCMVCINGCWKQCDQRGESSCPQCRETFSPSPVLRKNNMLAEVVEKLREKEAQAASPAHCDAEFGDVECDFCTEGKQKAIRSCLVCRVSFCESHLKPHHEVPALKKHKLVNAYVQLQVKMCSQHNEEVKVYCRTDQRFICYLCTLHEHKGHDIVAAVAERAEKQSQLKETEKELLQRIQEKEKKMQELRQAINTSKRTAQAAVDDGERIFTELILFIEKKRSEVTELIRAQETAETSRAEELLKKLEQEFADLKRRHSQLEQLSHTEDHIHFLQTFQSLSVSPGSEDSSSIASCQHLSFEGVRKSLFKLKEQLLEFCKAAFSNISPQAAAVQIILPLEPKTREDFQQYFCQLTLDPNTVNHHLRLCKKNKAVMWKKDVERYAYHPDRFHSVPQVLSMESMCGRCYWEVEWSSDQWMYIALSYKEIKRKDQESICSFGNNNQSWSLRCSPTPAFWHKGNETMLTGPLSSRIGVYVDHSAGTLSFYSVSDSMYLLHSVQTTFTQPLYAGFGVCLRGTVRLCDPDESSL
ncbi:hypothetical protein NFI96_013512 [Prochilodus magdalenae]|nr:hypothetical protein NFI96_013512 [Prochilodus magdalenae]